MRRIGSERNGMKTKWNKIISLAAAVMVGVSTLTGCTASSVPVSSNPDATEETAAAGPSASQASGEETTAAEVKEKGSKDTLSVDHLTMTYVTSPLNIPSIIDKNEKIFSKELPGVDLKYAEITSGADQTQALASGDVDVLYAVGGTSVILSAANGADIKVLDMYSRAPEAFVLFAKDEKIASPEDLRGKTIAGPAGTNLHELLVSYLATANMTLDDVNFVNMSIPDAKAALDGGSADAALLGGAAAYNAEKAGYHKVADGKGLISAIICVAVTKKFYDAHPDVIAAIRKGEDAISDYMEKNHKKAMEEAAAELSLDESAVEDMYGYYDFSTKITDDDKKGFQKTADFMYKTGMIEDAFDTSSLYIEEN